MVKASPSHLPGRTGYTLCGKPITKNVAIAYGGLSPTCRACQRASRNRPKGVNLHLRGVSPDVAATIKQYQVAHGLYTLSEAVQGIVEEWDELREYFEEHDEKIEISKE